jgi:HEAT repeat protein
MPAVADDFKREVEAEIRVLLSLFRGDPNARERLSVLLIRTPERLVQMIREAEDAQTLENLALLLPRLGAPGVETMLAAYFGTDTTLRINVALLLARFVAQGRSMSGEAVAVTRLAGRGMYLLMDRLIRFPSADPVARAELLTDLLAEAGKQDRTALLLMNTLLCWPEAALPVLLERYRRAATPEDLFRPADILYALCRTGTQFATAALIPSLRTGGGDSWEEIRALCGAEALARTLNIDWLDLGTVPDEQVALDARLRRKWAVPLRRDRDPAILRDLAAAVAALPSGNNLDRSVDTQDRAVRTLGHLRAREFLEPVLAAARRGAPTTRLTALRALADIADPRAAGLLIETTRSEDPAERRLAVEALGSLADPGCVPVLSEMLGDPDREVRRAALFALREIGSAEAAEAIRQAAMSPEPSVREAAARALSAVQHKQARTATPPADVRRMADIVRGGATPTTFISLEAVLRALPEVRPYTEQEITRCIAQACSDYSTTRRYLVEEGVLRRERGVYELTEVGQSVWRVERFLRDRYMQWGRML